MRPDRVIVALASGPTNSLPGMFLLATLEALLDPQGRDPAWELTFVPAGLYGARAAASCLKTPDLVGVPLKNRRVF